MEISRIEIPESAVPSNTKFPEKFSAANFCKIIFSSPQRKPGPFTQIRSPTIRTKG